MTKKKTKKINPRLARLLHGDTQQQMADALGVCVVTYRSKERGITDFTMTEAVAFCQALGYSLVDINWGAKDGGRLRAC